MMKLSRQKWGGFSAQPLNRLRPQQRCYPGQRRKQRISYSKTWSWSSKLKDCTTGPFSLPVLAFSTYFPSQNGCKTGRTQPLWDLSVWMFLQVYLGHPTPLTWLLDRAFHALNLDRGRARAENAATAQFLGVTRTKAVSVIANKARYRLEYSLTHLCND